MTRRALIAEVFMRRLYPLLLMASVWILFRGHNAPGGGFIAGLVAVAASSGYALVFGAGVALRRLPLAPARLGGAGVFMASVSGLPALLQGAPFLTHQWITVSLGAVDLPLSTAMLFDLGVYLCVWGTLGGYCLGLVGIIGEEV